MVIDALSIHNPYIPGSDAIIEQVDVLPSKNHVQHTINYMYNYITMKSCEQGFITKAHITTHTN